MEFLIGSMFVRVHINISARQVEIKSITPAGNHMVAVDIRIRDGATNNPLTIDVRTYMRGDKDAEQIAKS